jgi:heat shock protein HtpX
MAVALLFVAAMYLLALLLSFAVLVSVIADRAWGALLGWFIFAAALVIVAVMHWLEAVAAHELSHVANRDGMVMTFVSGPAMLGSAMSNADNPRGKIAYLILYWPVHFVGLCLMWTISRYREYVADRGAVAITGAPEQLMSALLKIAEREPRGDLRGGAAVSALCIVPAQRKRWLDFLRRFEIFMDHPPLEKRLSRLSDLARELGKPAR